MDASINKGAAGIAAGGSKSDDAFLRGECDKNSANNDNSQRKTISADGEKVELLILRALPWWVGKDENGRWVWHRCLQAKAVPRGGDPTQIKPCDQRAKYFQALRRDVSTFDKLRDVLAEQLRKPYDAAVPGGLVDGVDESWMQRLIYDTPDKKNPKIIHPRTLYDKPSPILMMDIDDMPPPPGVCGLRGTALSMRSLLLSEFHNARVIATGTGSYGLKRGCKLYH